MRSLFICALLAACLCAGSCSDPNARQVVLYSSVDEALLRTIIEDFEHQSGIEVLLVGDTEATKTTGLVQRVLAEKAQPRADVWWSSEPFGTIQLERAGVLEPYRSEQGERGMNGAWPDDLRSPCWYGFALRFRVLGYSEDRVPRPPTSLGELTEPQWRGRVGMARPQFGTTRGHMGVLVHQWGPARFRAWLEAMKANGIRLYDGNASIVRAIRLGEIDVGLTDTDDIWAARRNGWRIGAAYERVEPAPDARFPSTGPLALPNTVALVRNGPHPDEARKLIDFLLSEHAARIMAESDSHNIPVHPQLHSEFAMWAPKQWTVPPLVEVEAAIPQALAICEEVLE